MAGYNTTGLQRLQGGEQTKFDNTIGDLITIRRLCDHATDCSLSHAEESAHLWARCLHALERELWPYLSEEEQQQILEKRVNTVPSMKGRGGPALLIRKKLDEYHKLLLMLRGKKGLGLQASDDPSTAALR